MDSTLWLGRQLTLLTMRGALMHIKLATGRHFKGCTPVKGTFKGPSRQTLSLYISVDGHIFEELNNVKMNAQSSNESPEPSIEGLAGQQQQ